MDPYSYGGVPSPTTSRFPAGARGGNFLQPVSGPPTPNRMQMRRPSGNAAPSPRQSSSPAYPSPSSAHAPSPRVVSSPLDRQSNLALGPPPVWRRESGLAASESAVAPGEPVVLGRVVDGLPSTPARKASGGMNGSYSAGRNPGHGLGIGSPSLEASNQSTVTPGAPRMSRVPSLERINAGLSPRPPVMHPLPQQRSPSISSATPHHAKSPSAPLNYLSPDAPHRTQERQSSDPDLRTYQSPEGSRRVGSVSEDRSAAPSPRQPSDQRKTSMTIEREDGEPRHVPLNQYPSVANGKPALTPPALPRRPSGDILRRPQYAEAHPSTPPHAGSERSRDTRIGSAGSAVKPTPASGPSADENYHRASSVEARSSSTDLGKKKGRDESPSKATPRKGSGVLRSLFGKKKDTAPSPTITSPTSASFPRQSAPGPSTPSKISHRDFEPSSRLSPAQAGTTPPQGRMSRPRTNSSPSHPPVAFSQPRRAPAPPEYALPAPPPPQNPLPSLLSTDSTGMLSSSDSIPSLQSREVNGAPSKKAVNLLRRLSDQSTHSTSSLSYLTAEPSAASNPTSSETLPHFKSSGSLRLLALPDLGGGLDFGSDITKLADALSKPIEPNAGSFRPQLDGEDSWSSLLAAMSTGSPETISAAFEGARRSIAIQKNSELEKALADLQLEVDKQISSLPSASDPLRPDVAIDTPQEESSLSSASSPETAPAPLPSPPAVVSVPLSSPDAPLPSPPAPIKNPNLTITVFKHPPTSFTPSVAPLNMAKRTLSAPIVSSDQATSLYTAANPGEPPSNSTDSGVEVDQAPVMTSASLPSLRSKPALQATSFNGRVLTIAAARRQRTRKHLNYRLMAEKLSECLVAVRSSSARAPLIKGVLLPALYEIERCGYDAESVAENKLLRACCFEWLVGLVTHDLWLDHTPSERGAILEAVAALVESPALSEHALATDPADDNVFRKIMRTIVSFVMIKLSSKGIFQNTLSFAGHMLAFAFFRIDGIAQQLLSSMPITKMALVRMETQLKESEARSSHLCQHESEPFPDFLQDFSMNDPREYVTKLGWSACHFSDPEDDAAFRFQPGNWLRRWQSDDSELFFSFFRAYHRRLSAYFPSIQEGEGGDQLATSALFKAPGYAHLATVFTSKCVSYVQGKINSVTTTSNASTFNSTETAGFAGNTGKPPVLESANRRLSETIILLLSSRTIIDIEFGTDVVGSRLFGRVSELWFRILVSRTNMYEPKGVFCLFDLLDVVTTVPPDPCKELGLIPAPPLAFTTIFLLNPLSIILRNSDHALTLCKTVSFIFQHWDTLTADPVDRSAIVDLVLDQVVFDRLALFWSQSVRSYILRLIVFRLSHINQRPSGPTPAEVQMVATLNERLERIRRRHADLEPSVLGSILEDESASSLAPPPSPGLKRSRSTIAMVRLPTENASTADEYVPAGEGEPAGPARRASRTLDSGAEVVNGGGAVGKATQWFKRSFGGGGKKKRSSGDDLSSRSSSKTLTGIAEDASEGATSPVSPNSALPGLPIVTPPTTTAATTQHPPLFAALPSPVQSNMLSPARSSFESSSLPSPADFFFSEEQEKELAASDAFQPPSLALPGGTFPKNNPFFNAGAEPVSPTTSMASFTFGSHGSTDSSYTEGTATPTPTSPSNTTGVFSFGFAASPVSDSFEINASAPTVPAIVFPPGEAPPHPPPSPISPTNRMSRSFSRRSTLLTPLASHILEDLANAGEEPAKISAVCAAQKEKDAGYDKRLHPYAIQFLAELELTMEEYAEWYGPSGAGTLSADGAPPRLSVGWSFHDDD